MTARQVAVGAAVGAVLAWALKALAIGMAGGLDESAFEGPLFIVGFVLLVTAFVAFGVALTAGRGIGARIAGAIGGLAVCLLLFVLIEDPVGAMVPESAGWVKEEAGLWALSAVSAVVILVWSRRLRGAGPGSSG